MEDYLTECDPLPEIGNYWIVLDSECRPRCIVQTINIEQNKFKDVPVEVALAEGEGDLSLEYWRRVHRSFYAPFLKQWGVRDIEEATVVTEHFRIVHQRLIKLYYELYGSISFCQIFSLG